MMSNYHNKNIVVVGLGLSGRSAIRFLLKRGARVIGVDCQIETLVHLPEIKELEKSGLQIDHDQTEIDFTKIQLVILSPGIPLTHTLVHQAVLKGIEVIGEIELGCRHVPIPILGITGTNGKTTVTLLVNHVLNTCHIRSKALGNVGTPLTQEIDQELMEFDTCVLELSSYQLETMRQKVLDVGLILNITPDHLDRYKNMQAYAQAKQQIINCLKLEYSLFVEYRTWQNFSKLFEGKVIHTFGYTSDSIIYSDLKQIYFRGEKVFTLPDYLQGIPSHDLENLMGAYALCMSQGISGAQFIEAFKSFKKPPHRIEFVEKFQDVSYYDDSKGTNIDAVIQAVQSLKGPIILIAGGVDKGMGYQSWIKIFQNKVKTILVIGQASNKIYEDLNGYVPVDFMQNLEQAVKKAAAIARKGDSVLLSPGCASQDMFKDYIHRGQVFQQAVRSLVNEEIKNV